MFRPTQGTSPKGPSETEERSQTEDGIRQGHRQVRPKERIR